MTGLFEILDINDGCHGLLPIFKVIRKGIFPIIWIGIPIVLILMGTIDLGKAVVASKSDEIKNAAKSLMFRAIAGVFIFFIPTLVGFIFTLVDDWGDYKGEYEICATCISSPGKCK